MLRGAGIYRAWLVLMVLSLATTGLTIMGSDALGATFAAASLLGLAGLKARVILADYLELRHSSFWMRAFALIIGLFLIAAFVIYMLGAGRTA